MSDRLSLKFVPAFFYSNRNPVKPKPPQLMHKCGGVWFRFESYRETSITHIRLSGRLQEERAGLVIGPEIRIRPIYHTITITFGLSVTPAEVGNLRSHVLARVLHSFNSSGGVGHDG